MFRACRLDDIVYVVNDKTSFEKDEMLPYVGLEHLRQRSGGLKGWSPAANSISINTIFKAGDVLFGKLRPNLRKSALAPFDGYCSTDILVLRPKEGISSRFAAKVFQSERVGAAAEMTAAGTKMPRTSWNALRALEVYCPAIESQESLADVLDTLDTTIRQTEVIVEKLNLVKQGLLHDLLTRGIDTNGELRLPQSQAPHLYKDSPLGRVPNEWTVELLDSVAARGSGHTPSKSAASYWNGGIKWVSLADSHRLDQIYITETDKEISELGLANSSAVKHQVGTVILSRDAGVGKSAILAGEMAVSQHFIAWLCGQRLNNLYLYFMLQRMKPMFESIAIGSTIKTIGLAFFKKLQIIVPPRAEQGRIVEIILSNEAGLQTHSEELTKLRLQKNGLMDDLLTGRIPLTPLLETFEA
jgi:type I restriction enzyme S subunit